MTKQNNRLVNVPTEDIVKEIEMRKRKIGRLQQRREALVMKINEIDNEAKRMGAHLLTNKTIQSYTIRHTFQRRTLKEYVMEITKREPMRVCQIMRKIRESDYPTKANDRSLQTSVSRVLRDRDLFNRVAHGTYITA